MIAEADRLSGLMVEAEMSIRNCASGTEYVHDMSLLRTRLYALRRRVELALAAQDCDREEEKKGEP